LGVLTIIPFIDLNRIDLQMTEFENDLRHRCRNPKCRMKLPKPVSNEREAFCCRTCYEIFFRRRCRVCECTIEQPKRGHRIICKKAACRNAWKAKSGFGRYPLSSDAGITQKIADSTGSKQPSGPDRGWRIIAGPPLMPSQLHCASVSADEAVEAVRRSNARYWREANAAAEARCLVKRDSAPVNVIGGYRFSAAPAIDLRPTASFATKPHTIVTGDGLDIPDFLRRPALMQADPQGHCLSCPNSKTPSAGERPTTCQKSMRASEQPGRRSRAPAVHNGVRPRRGLRNPPTPYLTTGGPIEHCLTAPPRKRANELPLVRARRSKRP
jgi:hypothetical protein